MRKFRVLSYGLISVLCLTLLSGCGSGEEAVSTTTEETESYWETQTYDNVSGADFVKVGEGAKMQLLLNPATGTVRWLETATGAFQDTNMAKDEGMAGALSNAEQSDLIVRYFSGSKNANKLYWSTSTYDSYSMCASLGQLSYQLLIAAVEGCASDHELVDERAHLEVLDLVAASACGDSERTRKPGLSGR